MVLDCGDWRGMRRSEWDREGSLASGVESEDVGVCVSGGLQTMRGEQRKEGATGVLKYSQVADISH